MEVGQNGFLGQRFLNRFGDTKIDDLRYRLPILDGNENIRGLQVAVNNALLVGVLDGVAKLNKKSQAFLERELIRLAVIGNPNSANQLHHEKRATRCGCPAIQHACNARMIHERERLAFGFEPGHDALGVHAQLDHLNRNLAPNGFALLRPINDAEAPLADLLQKFVSANAVANLLLVEGELAGDFHGVPERLGDTLFEESVLLIVREQLFDGFPQLGIPGGRPLKKSRARLR